MTEIEAQRRIIDHALAMLGPVSLAAALHVQQRELEAWSAGNEQMPGALLERTADLILARYHGLPLAGAGAFGTGRLRS